MSFPFPQARKAPAQRLRRPLDRRALRDRQFPSACRDYGWRRRASFPSDAFASLEPPDAWLGELEAIASRITEINRAAAARPLEVGLDRDAVGFQVLAPSLDLRGVGAKTDVSRPHRAVWRHRQRIWRWRLRRSLGIEHQKDLVPAPIEQLPAWRLGEGLHPQNVAVKALCSVEVAGI